MRWPGLPGTPQPANLGLTSGLPGVVPGLLKRPKRRVDLLFSTSLPQRRVAIYLRVSTSKQDTENQLRELSAVADRSGWDIWKVYEDAGISGAKGRDKRPGIDAMMKAVNAKQFDLVAAWSVDRLGRSLTDLLGILQDLKEKGVDLFLHQQGLDTSTTAGKAMFRMLGVFAEFERGIIRERVNAGLARAGKGHKTRSTPGGIFRSKPRYGS